eukprot:EG_transcript_15362
MQTVPNIKMICCVYKDEGCQWAGFRKGLADHLQEECVYQEVACPNCGTIGARCVMWREPFCREGDLVRLQDAAAVSIQAAYRGCLGRRLVAQTRLRASDGDLEEDAVFWDHFSSGANKQLGLGLVPTPTSVRTFRQRRQPGGRGGPEVPVTLTVSTVSLDHLSSCASSEETTASEVSSTPERTDSRRVRWGSPRSSAQILPFAYYGSVDIGAIMSQIEPLPSPLPRDGLSLLRPHPDPLSPSDRSTCPA